MASIYAGVSFRSRLEAAWAVFFDKLGVEWEYERRAFEFDDGTRYLPDFWLPESRAWVEVKGRLVGGDLAKVTGLLDAAGQRGELVIIAGSPAGVLFGELQADGLLALNVDFVMCRQCSRWTMSMAVCRACGFKGEGFGQVDTFTAAWGSGRYSKGAYVWQGDEVVAVDITDRVMQWYADGLAALGSSGLTIWGGE